MNRIVEQACSHCGARNRIPEHRLGDDPVCGKCRKKLFPGEPLKGADDSFHRDVEGSAIPVLVDFWAPWCGPCRSMEPALRNLAEQTKGKLQVVKINVDENPHLARRFAIRSIPALKLFRGSSVVGELTGAAGPRELKAFIDQHSV